MKMILNPTRGALIRDEIVEGLSNECSMRICSICPFHEPEFSIADASGRKCAKVYYRLGGMTIDEIAYVYGFTFQNADMIINRAIRKLQESIVKNRKAGKLLRQLDMATDRGIERIKQFLKDGTTGDDRAYKSDEILLIRVANE